VIRQLKSLKTTARHSCPTLE